MNNEPLPLEELEDEDVEEVHVEVDMDEASPFQKVMYLVAQSVDKNRGRTLDPGQLKTLFEGYVGMARELTQYQSVIALYEEEITRLSEENEKKGKLWTVIVTGKLGT